MAGRPPFLSPSATQLLHAHRSAPVPPLRSVLGGGKDRGRPPWFDRAQALDAFFVRALAKDPEARFPSAAAMMDEFLVALGESSAGALPARRRSPRWYRLSRPGSSAACDVVVGPRAVLGKQPGCDVVCQALPSPEHDAITGRISREHAVLIWLDDRLSVLDQSKSGTYVNGRRAGPRLCAVPPGALLRLGESLILQVELLSAETAGVPGLVLRRMDEYAAGVPPTLLLWGRAPAAATPLAELGGEFSGGHLSVAQGGLWYSSHPGVNWRRRDGTVVLGAAPLRADDVLADSAGTVVVER